MCTTSPPGRRRRVGARHRLLAATAVATSLAVAASASALQPPGGSRPATAKDRRSADSGLDDAAQVREDQCRLNYVLARGGPVMKVIARMGLAGTQAELHTAADRRYWEKTPLSDAFAKDKDTTYAKMQELNDRDADWERALNVRQIPPGYTNAGFTEPPRNPDIFGQTGFSNWIAGQFWKSEGDFYERTASHASQESADAVKNIATTRYSPDRYEDSADWHAWEDMTFMHSMDADDARLFLQHGGFPTKASDPTSMEYRIDVENLKARFATCTSTNPPDPHGVLTSEIVAAHSEWQSELYAQRTQRDAIQEAEREANDDLMTAAQAMGEALGQSMIASRLTDWQDYFVHADPGRVGMNYPTREEFNSVKDRIAQARARASGRLFVASRAAQHAKKQAARVDTARNQAYAIADAAKVPRGRGLMYSQQAAQVAKASIAATQAAAKATETAVNAARASANDSKALNSLAMAQSHAAKAEFRRIAAQEAAADAKSAAEGAAAQAAQAAKNASDAKSAQARAEDAEKTAKAAADDAAAKRATAESERDKAKTEKETAEKERANAAAADQRAKDQRDVATKKLTEAQDAGKTASDKKDAAQAAERKAATARDNARDAERNRDIKAAKAAALEAYAASVDGTDAANDARAAATRARAAANDATTAANDARAAANEATNAAAAAREAATRADAAASRAKAASDAAQRDVTVTRAQVMKAHAAAADAIAASNAAAENVRQARAYADTAKSKAVQAHADAVIARTEADNTADDAKRSVGYAYATAQAALAARDSAAQVIQPANDAIQLGSPYKETDSSAGLAVLIGQSSKTAAEQQEAVAQAKTAQAARAADAAKDLAERADADAKAAAAAAADAAGSAAAAATSLGQARASGATAAAAARAAKEAESKTVQHNQRATDDAAAAANASTTASGYASQANDAADAAERDASSARSAASDAESKAGAARDVADQADRDATTAESAAAHARELADEAQRSASRTEDAADAVQQEANRSSDGPVRQDGVVMRPSADTKVDIDPKSDCVGTHSGPDIGCEIDLEYHIYGEMEFFLESCPLPGVARADCGASIQRDYLASAPLDVRYRKDKVHIDGLELTKAVLKGLVTGAFRDVIDCSHGKLSGCAWLAGSIVVPQVLGVGLRYAVALRAAIQSGTRLSEVLYGLRASGLSDQAIAGLEKVGAEALLGRCFPAGTKVLTDHGPQPIEKVKVGDRVWSAEPTTGKKTIQKVTGLHRRTVDSLVRIRTADGTVEATDSHRFWVQGRGWTEAHNLRAGDTFRTAKGSTDRVLGTTADHRRAKVYNFEVENAHTYFVFAGATAVLVHNECTPETLLADLIKDGDHIVLGVNPYSDKLAREVIKGNSKTFNLKALGAPTPNSDGRPLWMTGAQEALSRSGVRISVTLDGIPGAENADQALAMFIERGRPLVGGDWRQVATPGSNNGTAWEMAILRLQVVTGKRSWESIDWYWKGDTVQPTRPDWAQQPHFKENRKDVRVHSQRSALPRRQLSSIAPSAVVAQ